ncbi:protein of unknown function [Lutibacter agarilyticus]|uniref:DUF1835 domain-containing protein n=1 Tax=Lutibacter agarilyticus TaxID=1109740 RepID=A0A238VUR7_9FLAO|nr:DUF1835 domain-containing protein [Lutibacter agarilyticus]SNR37219.1 protein of unknown function [Lutibacter agarilyticus]
MSKIIHVLNGDSSVQLLKESGLEGEIAVWRELLCEGALHTDFASDDFWKKRYTYFKEELGVDRLEYYDKTIKEILKIEDISGLDEVVLWFEYDLFCQINLLAACSYLLKDFRKDVKLSLVCVGRVKGKENLQALTDFSPKDFVELYKNRLNLSKSNLIFAEECWKLYAENDVEKLKNFNFRNPKFQYLQAAINQHLKRFPTENGLNEIQQKIIEIINSKALTENEIVRELLIWQQTETVYGFGDVQYILELKKLQDFYTIKDAKYFVTTKAKKLLTIE